jgi:hypothetical protein
MQVLGRDSRPWLQPYLQLVLTMMRPQVPCSHSVSIPQTAALGGLRLWWFRSLKRLHSESRCISGIFHMGQLIFIPIGSMYGIYANIGGILMVNVSIYSIHGSYGIYHEIRSEPNDPMRQVLFDKGTWIPRLEFCKHPRFEYNGCQQHTRMSIKPSINYTHLTWTTLRIDN